MLRQISVTNLGCFDDQVYKVDFSEETLLAGPNNSGKSMLLTAMNLFRYYFVTGSYHWDTEYYRLHSYEAAVHSHDKSRAIKVSLTFRPSKESNEEVVLESDFHEGEIELRRSGVKISVRDKQYTNLLRKIWCIMPNRSLVPYESTVQHTADPIQPLRSNGSNVVNFLLERWTDRDEKWQLAEYWLRKIDPDMSMLKTPIRGNQASLETKFGSTDVNVSLQGSGLQSAAAIISALIFSPPGSTLIIEEPEAFLHPSSQEVIVDLINEIVKSHDKQVIFSTHSCNILLPLFRDIGVEGARRGEGHVSADPNKFSMWTFGKSAGQVSISQYPLHQKTFRQFRDDFTYIWG